MATVSVRDRKGSSIRRIPTVSVRPLNTEIIRHLNTDGITVLNLYIPEDGLIELVYDSDRDFSSD